MKLVVAENHKTEYRLDVLFYYAFSSTTNKRIENISSGAKHSWNIFKTSVIFILTKGKVNGAIGVSEEPMILSGDLRSAKVIIRGT